MEVGAETGWRLMPQTQRKSLTKRADEQWQLRERGRERDREEKGREGDREKGETGKGAAWGLEGQLAVQQLQQCEKPGKCLPLGLGQCALRCDSQTCECVQRAGQTVESQEEAVLENVEVAQSIISMVWSFF